MSTEIPLTSQQLETAIAEAEHFMEEHQYENGESIAVPLIPLIPYYAHETRLRVYLLLVKDPLFSFCDPEKDDLRRSTLGVMNDKETSRSSRLLAHVLYCYTGKIEPQEQYEAHALTLAEETLQDPGSTQSERLLAHLLSCHRLSGETKEERDAIKGHIGELERLGGEHVFLLGCKAAKPAFHLATECVELNRAVEQMRHPAQKANLLEKKLYSLIYSLIETNDDSDEEMEWIKKWTVPFQEAYRDFLVYSTSLRHRVIGELFLSIYAVRMNDDAMGGFHFVTAKELAKELGHTDINGLVDSLGGYLADIHEQREAVEEDDDDGEGWKRGAEDDDGDDGLKLT